MVFSEVALNNVSRYLLPLMYYKEADKKKKKTAPSPISSGIKWLDNI